MFSPIAREWETYLELPFSGEREDGRGIGETGPASEWQKKRFEEKARSAFLHHLSGNLLRTPIFFTASNNIELTGLEAVARSSKRARYGEHANRE